MDQIPIQIRRNAEDAKNFLHDLGSWEKEMKDKENKLKNTNIKKVTVPLRSNKEANKENRIKSGDYRAWDKFDVDKALEEVDERENEQVDVEAMSEEMKNKGNEFFKKGDYKKALGYYSQGIELMESPVLYVNRALARMKLEQYDHAIADCTKALEFDKKNVKAFWRRATSLCKLGRMNESMKDFETAMILEPTNKTLKEEYQKLKEKMKAPKPERRRLEIVEIGGLKTNEKEELENLKREKEIAEKNKSKTNESKIIDLNPVKVPNEKLIFNENQDDISNNPNVNKIIQLEENKSSNNNNINDEEKESETLKVTNEEKEPDPLKVTNEEKEQRESSIEIPETKFEKLSLKLDPPSSSYEFERDWKSVKDDDSMAYLYIKSIDPNKFDSFFKTSLDKKIFMRIVSLIKDKYQKESESNAFNLLMSLSRIPRLNVTLMFLSKEEKELLTSTINQFEEKDKLYLSYKIK